MDRIRTRRLVVLAALFAVSILVTMTATTAAAAPARGTEAAPKRAPQPRQKAPPAPRTKAPARRTPAPRQTAPPRRGVQPKRTEPPSRRTPRPSAAPRTRGTPRPRTTPPTWHTPRPHVQDTPAPRRGPPNINVTPIQSAAPDGVVRRPHRKDHPGASGHGWKYKKHGHHHHHAYCGCYGRDWSRLLYGYSNYCGTSTTYITFSTQLPFDVYGPAPCTVSGTEAWALLADGQAAAAYRAFECLSPAVPDDGYLLVGLAISAAAIGEHDHAVTALRTAMRVDPVSLLDVPGSDRLDVLLSHTADHYDTRARAGYGDVDALFMVAALRYLLGQHHIAHYAVEIAIALGDVDPSTRNLKGVISYPLLERPDRHIQQVVDDSDPDHVP